MHQGAGDPRPAAAWADDQLAPGMDGDEACAQCHGAIAASPATVAAHTRHQAGSSGSRCYNCHMPYTTYGLLKTIRSHTVSVPSVDESVATGRPNACNLCHLDKTLGWTADALARRGPASGGPAPTVLTADQRRVSAALLWALAGDAGQRAIVAQAMGWKPAQDVSGTAWMAPALAQLLDDPYDAVRFIASRSLQSIPAFASLRYDFTAPQPVRYAAQMQTMRIWDQARRGARVANPAVLLDEAGALQVAEMLRLLATRDNTPILLRE
jgi:hypothetical protein